jgi:hypothetical protein
MITLLPRRSSASFNIAARHRESLISSRRALSIKMPQPISRLRADIYRPPFFVLPEAYAAEASLPHRRALPSTADARGWRRVRGQAEY